MRELEVLILTRYIQDDTFAARIEPYVNLDYFEQPDVRQVFQLSSDYRSEYGSGPAPEVLSVGIEQLEVASHDAELACKKLVSQVYNEKVVSNVVNLPEEWILQQTQKFMTKRACYLKIMQSLSIIDGSYKGNLTEEAIPDLLREALSINFDDYIGHNYFADAEARYEYYHKIENKLPTSIEMLNRATNGGPTKKALIIALAGCVHPNTKVRVKVNRQESEVSISAIQQLLAEGYEVEIDSLDGYVPVLEFVDKGTYEGYELTCGERTVIVNENHLFETTEGWELTKDLMLKQSYAPIHYLTDNGIEQGYIRKTNSLVPIVDLVIDHPNHRYFANGISSHNTNVGKSLWLTDQSAHYLMQNKKVLYITMEMAEEKIAERIDARLMETDLNDLDQIPRGTFLSRIETLRSKTQSDLIIREYPPHVFNANILRSLLKELKQKQQFVPDVIALDYLGLCASYRLNPTVGSFQYLKSVTEELRGVMVTGDYLGMTAMQTNREGQTSADVDLTDMSESHGISMGADFIFAMMAPPELAAMGAYRFKQLKSRFGDVNKFNSFLVGVDKAKMTLYNMDNVEEPSAPPPSNIQKSKFGGKSTTQLKT